MADPQNYDLALLKEIVRQSSLKLKLPKKHDHSEDLFTMSLALAAAIKKTFYQKSEYIFEKEPVIVKKPIIQFNKRFRVNGMEKFNDETFFSVVHLYKSKMTLENEDPAGVIIVYVARKSVPEILRLLQYPYIDYDFDEDVLDGIGALTNIVAGQFKKELIRLGYMDLEMSHFKSYINSVFDGLAYPNVANHRYEIGFDVDHSRQLVVDMIMTPLPKSLRNVKWV